MRVERRRVVLPALNMRYLLTAAFAAFRNIQISRSRRTLGTGGSNHLAQDHCVLIERRSFAVSSWPVHRLSAQDGRAGERADTRAMRAAQQPQLLHVVDRRRVMPSHRYRRLGQSFDHLYVDVRGWLLHRMISAFALSSTRFADKTLIGGRAITTLSHRGLREMQKHI